MDDKYLEELFALPIGLTLEATVDGQKIYSSQKLKEAFLKSIGSTGRSSKIYNQIESLVMKKKILVPCFLSKNMFRFFAHKMFGRAEDKNILGFYHMVQKRVFILIDNNTTSIGTAQNDFIASTTMHECVHLYADRMRGKFNNLFKQELERFYISYFSRVFCLKRKPDVTKIVKMISKFEYQRSIQMNKQLMIYYKLLYTELYKHSELSEQDFLKLASKLIISIKLSLISFGEFIGSYRRFLDIYSPLDRAYNDAFGKKNTVTTPYQELSTVSEVICVLSELNPTHPKIKKMFKDMA